MRRTSRRVTGPLGAAVLGCALALSGCSAPASDPPAVVTSTASGPLRGTDVTSTGWALPDVSLTDTSGAAYSVLHGSAEHPATQSLTVVFFGYTNCPDVCTGIIADIASALVRVSADVRADTRVVIITTDPARDTPGVLRAYLDRIDPDFIGLTGDLTTITTVATSVGVPIEDAKVLPSGGYEVSHGTQVLGFAGDGEAAVVWTSPTPIGDLATDFTTLATR